jgi:hypothetical protein
MEMLSRTTERRQGRKGKKCLTLAGLQCTGPVRWRTRVVAQREHKSEFVVVGAPESTMVNQIICVKSVSKVIVA